MIRRFSVWKLKLIAFVKARTRPLGILGYSDSTLPPNIFEEAVRKSRCNPEKKNVDNWHFIFEWICVYRRLDKALMALHLDYGYLRRHDFLISKALKFCNGIKDIIAGVFCLYPKKYYLLGEESGNHAAHTVVYTCTKNKAREKQFLNSAEFRIVDFFLSDTGTLDGYELLEEMELDIFSLITVVALKIRFFYVPLSAVVEATFGSILFARQFESRTKAHAARNCAIVREGPTVLNRTFLTSAKHVGIDCVTWYPGLVVSDYAAPFPTKKVVVTSLEGLSPSKRQANVEFLPLNGYPYLQWQAIARLYNKPYDIGFLLGDEIGRHKFQSQMENAVLSTLGESGWSCLIRIHPQEAARESRRAYYEGLLERYPNATLDQSSGPEGFFSKVNILITYSRTTMVGEALLCKIPVIVIKAPSSDINEQEINLAGPLAVSCHSVHDLSSSVNELFSRPISINEFYWDRFLKSAGLNFREEFTTDHLLKKAFGKPLEEIL